MLGLTQPITDLAHQVDGLFYWILGITGTVFVLVEGLLIWYLFKYKRTHAAQQGLDYHGNTRLEIIWTLVPALILVLLGYYSVPLVKAAQTPPADSYVIQVIGHKWSWEFKYPNGVDTVNNEPLRIPAGKNVLFKISSADVIHDFWIPQIRVKQDAVPGRMTEVWAKVNDTGIFPIECAEYCGTLHSQMISKMTVLSDAEFQAWSDSALKAQQEKEKAAKEASKNASTAQGDPKAGEALAKQYNCLACHAIDGSKMAGPTWKGLYGSTVALADGTSVKADDAYLTESITAPSAKVVKGFSAMPPQAQMSPADVNNLVAYIKTLK